MSLDTNVYKLPSFSKQGFELQQERKKERDTEVSSTMAEDTYMQSKHLLKGHFIDDASLAFGAFQEAGIKYKRTGDESDRLAMKDAANQLKLIIAAGKTQSDLAGKAYETALTNQFQGYSMSKEEIEKSYTDFNNRQWESKMENGVLMVKEGDNFVPLGQSSIYSSTPNANNVFIIPKTIDKGKYFLVDSYMELVKNVSGSSTQEKLDKIYQDFNIRLEEPDFASNVAMHYYVKDLGLADGRKGYSADDVREAEKRFAENPEFRQAAIESYKKEIAAKSGIYLKSAGAGFSEKAYQEESKDGQMVTLYPLTEKAGNIVALGKDSNGNYYKVVNMDGINSDPIPASASDVALVENKAGSYPLSPAEAQAIGQTEEQTTVQTQEQTESQTQEQTQEQTKKDEQFQPKTEEEFRNEALPRTDNSQQGFGSLDLNIPQEQMQGMNYEGTGGIGVAPPADSPAPELDMSDMLLPQSFYKETLDSEGGLAYSPKDRAARKAENKDAPKVTQAMIDSGMFGDRKPEIGQLIHTNRGVTYSSFKSWAEDNNIPKKEYQERFLNLTEREALSVVDRFAEKSGADQFESKILRSMFTQNVWGTGKVFAADFKKGRSKKYRSLLDWLQEGTGRNFKDSRKLSAEDVKAIEDFYNENPEKFINEFIDKKQIYFTTLDEFNEFGDGWSGRAEKLRTAMLNELKSDNNFSYEDEGRQKQKKLTPEQEKTLKSIMDDFRKKKGSVGSRGSINLTKIED